MEGRTNDHREKNELNAPAGSETKRPSSKPVNVPTGNSSGSNLGRTRRNSENELTAFDDVLSQLDYIMEATIRELVIRKISPEKLLEAHDQVFHPVYEEIENERNSSMQSKNQVEPVQAKAENEGDVKSLKSVEGNEVKNPNLAANPENPSAVSIFKKTEDLLNKRDSKKKPTKESTTFANTKN